MYEVCYRMLILLLLLSFLMAIYTLPVRASSLISVKYCTFKEVSLYAEAYCDQDNGEAILFIHGLGGNHIDGSFLYHLENKYTTITFDLLNHGKSGKQKSLTWDVYVESIKAVLDSYHIRKAHFIGHSLGADLAMLYATKYPQDVIDIILLDRAYYNFYDVEQFNFNATFYKVVEYDLNSELEKDAFNDLIDMSLNNDITKTWKLNKDVLLLAANPYWAVSTTGVPNIVDYISMVKQSPSDFGVTIEQANSLPNLTSYNLNSYMEFLKIKISEFSFHNKRFYTAETPFEHNMVNNESAKTELLNYVLEFINHNDKKIATETINKMITEYKKH